MCRELFSCDDFKAILTPFSEVTRGISKKKCFVSHRPPSREGGSVKVGRSVGQKKKKKDEHMIEGFWVPVKAGLLSKLGYVVLSFVIRWYNRNRTTKCLKRLQKRGIDDNLRQLVLIRQDRVLVKLKYLLLYKWFWILFSFPKNWVGRAMGNETYYGDGLNGVRMALKSAQETSSRHIWSRKTLFQMRSLFTHFFFFAIGDFPIQFSIYTNCRIHHVFWASGACGFASQT